MNYKSIKVNFVRIVLVLTIAFWMSTIFSFSSETGEESQSLSDKITIRIVKVINSNYNNESMEEKKALFNKVSFCVRKTGHYCEYIILGLLVSGFCITYIRIRNNRYFCVLIPTIYSLIYASTDEFHQGFVEGRSPQIFDVGIDTFGGLTGGLILLTVAVIIMKFSKEHTMKEWEKNIRKVTPYVPGEQPVGKDIIKLNTNECPYKPSLEVEKIIHNFNIDKLRLYPDPEAKVLVDAIAEYYNIGNNQVFVGVGSDDVIGMSFLTFFNSKKPILFPDISYSFYDVWADLFNVKYETVPLNKELEIVPEEYYKENGGIIFPNPNAPTAIALEKNIIEDIIKKNQESVVIIDEAYVDFGAQTVLDLIDKYENLLVVRTFSKSRAMAGIRIGYAMGNPKLIKALQDVKYSYNSYTMNQPAIYAGAEAIKDHIYFKELVEKTIKTREEAKTRMTELGFTYTNSKTNFLFATHKTISAKTIFEKLKEKNIYVRYFDKPRINNYLRITIGTDDEMSKLYTALEEIAK